MNLKEIVINISVILVGIILISCGIGYIRWFSNLITELNPLENYIIIVLISLGYIIPCTIFFTGGMFLIMKTIMDPWQE